MKEKVDILSKKRPTVNELKTEVIRLRKDLDKSENGLNHYKSMFDSCYNDNNKLRQDAINLKTSNEQLFSNNNKLKTSNNDLEARNQALKDIITSLEADLDKVERDCEELKAKNQYNSSAFVIAAIIAFGSIITMILRLV